MTSIPQLRKDKEKLQLSNMALKDRVKSLENEIAELKRSRPQAVVKEVIVYRDNPKHIDMIRKLRGR